MFELESYQKFNFDTWVEAGCPRFTEDHFQNVLPAKESKHHMLCQLQYTQEVNKVIVLNSFEPILRSIELTQQLQVLATERGFQLFPVSHDINATRTATKTPVWAASTVAKIGELFAEEIAEFGFQAPN